MFFPLPNEVILITWIEVKCAPAGLERQTRQHIERVSGDAGLSLPCEYCGQNETAVRTYEPLFADNRASKCGKEIHHWLGKHKIGTHFDK